MLPNDDGHEKLVKEMMELLAKLDSLSSEFEAKGIEHNVPQMSWIASCLLNLQVVIQMNATKQLAELINDYVSGLLKNQARLN